jgi:hypothetical protein
MTLRKPEIAEIAWWVSVVLNVAAVALDVRSGWYGQAAGQSVLLVALTAWRPFQAALYARFEAIRATAVTEQARAEAITAVMYEQIHAGRVQINVQGAVTAERRH